MLENFHNFKMVLEFLALTDDGARKNSREINEISVKDFTYRVISPSCSSSGKADAERLHLSFLILFCYEHSFLLLYHEFIYSIVFTSCISTTF